MKRIIKLLILLSVIVLMVGCGSDSGFSDCMDYCLENSGYDCDAWSIPTSGIACNGVSDVQIANLKSMCFNKCSG